MSEYNYNQKGRIETGFDNSLDHSTFGHWRNPEYQELNQDYELHEQFKDWFWGVGIQGDFQSAKNKLNSSANDLNELENDWREFGKQPTKHIKNNQARQSRLVGSNKY